MPRKIITSLATVALAVTLSAGVPWVENNKKPKMRDHEPLTAAQRADEAYRRGRAHFRRALEIEDKALAATSDTKRRRYRDKATQRYRASADAYEECLARALKEDMRPDYLPHLYQELGDARFKTGDYVGAVDAYDRTLAIAPAFLRALYGRAEAKLALDDVAAMQADYESLLVETETSAAAWGYVDALLESSGQWIAAKDAEPDGGAAQTMQSIRRWRDEQLAELEDTVRWTLLEAQE